MALLHINQVDKHKTPMPQEQDKPEYPRSIAKKEKDDLSKVEHWLPSKIGDQTQTNTHSVDDPTTNDHATTTE